MTNKKSYTKKVSKMIGIQIQVELGTVLVFAQDLEKKEKK